MSDSSFNKEDFLKWIMGLETQVITDELKRTICEEFELIQDYPKHVIAIDFDLTICMSDYPNLGPMREGAAEVIRKLYNEGFGIVINTCRAGKAQGMAEDWLKENNIPFHYINCNFPHLIEFYKADCRKISADLYIDDKCLGGLPHWNEIYKIIQEKFKK